MFGDKGVQVHPKGMGWGWGYGSVSASQILHTKLGKPFLHGPGFVHGGTVMLRQERAFRKLLTLSWKNTVKYLLPTDWIQFLCPQKLLLCTIDPGNSSLTKSSQPKVHFQSFQSHLMAFINRWNMFGWSPGKVPLSVLWAWMFLSKNSSFQPLWLVISLNHLNYGLGVALKLWASQPKSGIFLNELDTTTHAAKCLLTCWTVLFSGIYYSNADNIKTCSG